MAEQQEKSWLKEIVIGIVVAVIAGVILSRLGLDKTNGDQAPPVVDQNNSSNSPRAPGKPTAMVDAWAGTYEVEGLATIHSTIVFHSDGTYSWSGAGKTVQGTWSTTGNSVLLKSNFDGSIQSLRKEGDRMTGVGTTIVTGERAGAYSFKISLERQ